MSETYSASDIKEELESAGEIIVVLESGIEYELHLHDTEFPNDNEGPLADTLSSMSDSPETIETEGLVDGEYRVTRIPVSRIEHTYIHKES